MRRGVARIFKGGGVDFLLKRARERALLTYVYASFWNWSPWWVLGCSPERHSISLHLKAPNCEKIDILNAFSLWIFPIQWRLLWRLLRLHFVATNFQISLFFFPQYDFNLIILASQRASLAKGGGGVGGRSHPPTPLASMVRIYKTLGTRLGTNLTRPFVVSKFKRAVV